MIADERLARAMKALRDSSDGASARAAETRSRVLVHAQRERLRGRRVVLIVMPLAAALIVSTAWGAVTGRLPRWLGIATTESPPQHGPAPMAPRSDRGRVPKQPGANPSWHALWTP